MCVIYISIQVLTFNAKNDTAFKSMKDNEVKRM